MELPPPDESPEHLPPLPPPEAIEEPNEVLEDYTAHEPGREDTSCLAPGEEYTAPEYDDTPPLADDPDQYETETEAREPVDHRAAIGEERLAELEAAFAPYQEQRDRIMDALEAGEDPETIPGYVASGSVCHVYGTPDGKMLKLTVVPQPDDNGNIPPEAFVSHGLPPDVALDEYIYPMEETKHLDGVEHMDAATTTRGGAVLCETAPGKRFDTLTAEERDAIPPEDFAQLFQTLKDLPTTVQVDLIEIQRNLFYEPGKFTIIDIQPFDGSYSAMEVPEVAESYAQARVLLDSHDYSNEYPPAAATFLEAYKQAFGEEHAERLREAWEHEGVGTNRAPELYLPNRIAEHLADRVDQLRAASLDESVVDGFGVVGIPYFDGYKCPEGTTMDDVHTAREASERLAEYDLCVLPSQPVMLDDEIYQVTQHVNGVMLDDLPLTDRKTDAMVAMIDTTWEGICDNLTDGFLEGRRVPAEVEDPARWKAGDVNFGIRKIWLANAPTETYDPRAPDAYERALLSTANRVGELELHNDIALPAARAAIQSALTYARDSAQFGDGYVQATQRVLETKAAIQPDDAEAIQSARTR